MPTFTGTYPEFQYNDFIPIKKGDLVAAKVFSDISILEGDPPVERVTLANPITLVEMAFEWKGGEVFKWSSSLTADAPITILSFNSFSIDAFTLEIPARCYFYDLQITLQDGLKITPIGGKWEVIANTNYL